MKKLFLTLLALMTVAHAARADIVGQAGDDYIHQWIAPNGQALYFVSAEMEPLAHMEDVNFDGAEDVVVVTSAGASNLGAEFFVWADGRYEPVTHFGADALTNYTLYPEAGLVETYVQEGWAGVLHTRMLWRWNDSHLELVGTASGAAASMTTYDGRLTTVITDHSMVRLQVWDNLSPNREQLMDIIVYAEDEEAVSAGLEEERRELWQELMYWDCQNP